MEHTKKRQKLLKQKNYKDHSTREGAPCPSYGDALCFSMIPEFRTGRIIIRHAVFLKLPDWCYREKDVCG